MLKSFTMPPKPEVLSDYLLKNYPGASYYSAYEAGFSGLRAHYQLCELGINNILVNPADVPGTQKDKLQISVQFVYRHTINACRTFILLDMMICTHYVLAV